MIGRRRDWPGNLIDLEFDAVSGQDKQLVDKRNGHPVRGQLRVESHRTIMRRRRSRTLCQLTTGGRGRSDYAWSVLIWYLFFFFFNSMWESRRGEKGILIDGAVRCRMGRTALSKMWSKHVLEHVSKPHEDNPICVPQPSGWVSRGNPCI